MKLGIFSRRKPEAVDQFGVPGRGNSTAISAATIVLILGGWWVATRLELVRPLFLPSPEMVISKFNKIACTGYYFEHLLVALGARAEVAARCFGFSEHALHEHILWSLYRVFGSFFLAVITAVPIGVAMGMSRYARGVFDPPIEFYRPIPPLAYLPLTIIWFGIGESGKFFLIYLACFAPIAINARAGVRSVSVEQIHAAYSMGATSRQVIRQVVIKAGAAGDTHGNAGGDRLRLDDACRSRDGGGQGGNRRHGAERRPLPGDRHRVPGYRGDRRGRLCFRFHHAAHRGGARPLERQGLSVSGNAMAALAAIIRSLKYLELPGRDAKLHLSFNPAAHEQAYPRY